MSSKDYYNMMGYEAALQNKSIAANDEAFGLINNYTDWQREGLQDTPQIHQVQLSVSGGKKDITYYISGNYAQEDGIMINSNYKRLNLRSRINAKLSKRVDLSQNGNTVNQLHRFLPYTVFHAGTSYGRNGSPHRKSHRFVGTR